VEVIVSRPMIDLKLLMVQCVSDMDVCSSTCRLSHHVVEG
jgi:hypothetical protein